MDLFNDDEKTKIQTQNTNAKVWLEVSETNITRIPEENRNKMEDKAKEITGTTKITHFEVDLFKKIGDKPKKPLHELETPIQVTIQIPASLRNSNSAVTRTYKMIRLHNNQVDELDGKFNKTTNEFTFETNRFSTYGIVYKDTRNSSGSSGGSGSGGVVIPVREVSIELEKTTLTKKGESVTLNAKVEPSYATYKKLEWSSSDPDIAAVDENGTVTVVGNKSGTVTITAKSINGKTVSVTITVELEPGEGESGDNTGDKPDKDDTGNTKEIQFESSNSRIAAVTGKGVIKAKKKGTCYIYVYAQNGIYKRIKVTVK